MDEDGVIHAIEKKGFTLICIFGIKDIIRKEVPGAVAQCQKAGITVRMVTGDNKITAMAIAKECKIIDEKFGITSDSVLEGPEFYERVGGLICKTCKNASPCNCDPDKVVEGVKNKAAFLPLIKHLRVLARSRPEDKYLLVTGLKEFGDVVAVTGDGTNDAPALKKADVGFAMGITGTDVSKHAADIIVMDDNFASIVKACMWGRNIYDNIRKFLQFQITVNLVALFTAFVGAVVLKQSPLQAIQLLWVNLIMDSLGSLALATEPPKIEILNRPPHGRNEYIISRRMVKHILGMFIYQIIIVYSIVFAGEFFFPEPEMYYRFDRPDIPYVYPGRLTDWDGSALWSRIETKYGITSSRHMSNAFNVFVCLQIFNMINVRKVNDEINIFNALFENPYYIIIWFIIVGGQVIIVELTGETFKVTPGGIHYAHWIIAIILGFTTWIVRFILTFVPI
jgi:P-type Ca2+ transporter type 2B